MLSHLYQGKPKLHRLDLKQIIIVKHQENIHTIKAKITCIDNSRQQTEKTTGYKKQT